MRCVVLTPGGDYETPRVHGASRRCGRVAARSARAAVRKSHNSRAKGHAMVKNTICLWYDKDAEAAARFYAETFPDSAVGAVHRAPSDYPSGKQGDVLTVEFTVAGIPCIGLNRSEERRVGEECS